MAAFKYRWAKEESTMDAMLDFGAIFRRLAAEGEREHHTVLGGVDVRLVRVDGGASGRWDTHDDTTETVIIWSGAFDVAFRDHAVSLTAGQCCVVPLGAEHRGTSPTCAEVVLFKAAPASA
jgi:mannose-6-phosphate isomerase-like protein (cupin superfamily)